MFAGTPASSRALPPPKTLRQPFETLWQGFLGRIWDHPPAIRWTLLLTLALIFVIALALVGGFEMLPPTYRERVLDALFVPRYTPEVHGNRLSIYVARFGDDKLSQTARDRVIASIRSELGPERVEVLPAGIKLTLTPDVSDDAASDRATAEARLLLREKHGDLLIWGKVYAIPGMKPQLDLRFVSAESARLRNEPFGLTDKLMLDPEFGPEMGAALAAVASALAAPAVAGGQYLVRTLVPVANRLAPLTRNTPTSIRAEDRAMLRQSYGFIQSVIGQQSGESARLEEAVVAFRAALLERTRERVPHDWALTQNNLGNTLLSLGYRETDTARLEEALVAFRAALLELSRERVPLEWAASQVGLRIALMKLGERENGTARLKEAVVAHRAALLERSRERVPLKWASRKTISGTPC
jgi:hypothetical protein